MNIGETLKFITDRGTYYKIFQSLFMDLTIYAFFGPLNSFKCGLLNVHIGAAPGGSVGNNQDLTQRKEWNAPVARLPGRRRSRIWNADQHKQHVAGQEDTSGAEPVPARKRELYARRTNPGRLEDESARHRRRRRPEVDWLAPDPRSSAKEKELLASCSPCSRGSVP